MTRPEIERVAKGLNEGQCRGLHVVPAWGFPAGHNAWPEMQYDDGDPDEPICEGEDMDLLLRRGLVEATQEGDEPPECCCFEMADATWTLRLTDLGLAVRRYLQENAQ